MGLSNRSTGIHAVDTGLVIQKQHLDDTVVALAGNPNVGKSTVFNTLTGMNQHTGNWPGKTVTNAQGYCTYRGRGYVLVDIPGCYSLMAHSAEEEVARDFICFGEPDVVAVVCDATCLERNLNLVLQTIEITDRVVVCVNLMDEARRKGIQVDLESLSARLGVPVIPVTAREGEGLDRFMEAVEKQAHGKAAALPVRVHYSAPIEEAVASLLPVLEPICAGKVKPRWLALRLLEQDASILKSLESFTGLKAEEHPEIGTALTAAWTALEDHGISGQPLRDQIVSGIVLQAEQVCSGIVQQKRSRQALRDRQIDRILTSKWTGFPIMILLLAVVFWLTISGANYPSQLLASALFKVQEWLAVFFTKCGMPIWLNSMLVDGVWRVLAWVVSVMLPPMAIFFPLFTLLEDVGYLPRVAFNLDRYFKKCNACGKQALTTCMGFGCNAAGIVGCRIIDSPRERLIAMLTNNFVPCNGRFPPPRLE